MSEVIDATARFGQQQQVGGFPVPQPLPTSEKWGLPHTMSLPFASDKRWCDYGWPDSFWADVPTSDYLADRARGKHFAMLTLGAMIADGPHSERALASIFESIVQDAARRRVKGGKGSRTLTGTVGGFLEVMAKFITGVLHDNPEAEAKRVLLLRRALLAALENLDKPKS